MAGYTKLFSTILASTIWREPPEVRVVWITMLAMADATGRVDGSIPGLADLSRVPVEKCQEALKCLSEPDYFSRTKTDEGRRIKEVEGGWLILNYLKYRESNSTDLRKEQNREAQKRWREKHKLTVSKDNPSKPPSAQAEASAEAEEKAWIASLSSDPANAGVDVAREADRARLWCKHNRRQFTRRMFVNWLLRVDRVIKSAGTGHAVPWQRPETTEEDHKNGF